MKKIIIQFIATLFNKKEKRNSENSSELETQHLINCEPFISELMNSSSFPKQWDELCLNYEYFLWKEDYMEVYSFNFYHNSKKIPQNTPILLPIEASDELIEIHTEMKKRVKEIWTHLKFTMTQKGNYTMDFKYGMPPKIKAQLIRSGEL